MALKHGDGVMCTSQEQWERITEKLKRMGLSLCSYMMKGGYDEWPFVQRSGEDNPRISGSRNSFHGLKMPEADFLAACKEEAIKLGVYEDRLEEGDVCMVVGPDCNGGMSFKGETVTVVNDYGPNCFDLSQMVEARTKWGPIWLPITSLQKITTPEDDEIRVGDMVEIVDDSGCHEARGKRGNRYTVDAVEGQGEYDIVECAGIRMFRIRFKKIKAGGPVSTNKTTNTDGKVYRQLESEGDNGGSAQAIRAGSSKGRIAVGLVPAGNAIKARTGAGRIGGAQVRFNALAAGHL